MKIRVLLEIYWRPKQWQLLFRLGLAWQVQDVRSHSWETDLCSCTN